MEWIHYPTERDRKNRTNGAVVKGESWSAGPGGNEKWCWPAGAEHTSNSLVLVRTYGGLSYSVGELPRGTVTAAVTKKL